MKNFTRLAAAVLLGFSVHSAMAQTPPVVPPAKPADLQFNDNVQALPVEVCFVLDTTGSMGGLIEGAKQKIWSIANSIAKDNPKSTLKIALIPYRDRGDAYVTKVIDLTDDLDSMYSQLMSFRAEGGGDQPESVNQALIEAVQKVSWSRGDAVRIIFLVGDAPPHMDYPNDVKYPATLKIAVEKHIIVDTVQCGDISSTVSFWRDIAALGNGTYLHTAQDGGMTAISTPMDKKMADLNTELTRTVVPYGTVTQQKVVNEKVNAAATAPASIAADRAAFNAAGSLDSEGGGRGGGGGRAVQGAGDLVNDMQSNKELVKELKTEELSPEMQKMTEQERKDYLDKQLAKRQQLNQQINDLAREREAYIRQEQEKNAKKDSFDLKVTETVHNNANAAREAVQNNK